MSILKCSKIYLNPLIFNSYIARQLAPHVFNSKFLFNSIEREKICFLHSSKLNNKDNNALSDPEMQELIKSMYKDFEADSSKMDAETESEVNENSLSKKHNNELWEEVSDNHISLDSEQHLQNPYDTLQFHEDIIYDYDEEQILREKGLWKVKQKEKSKTKIVYKRGKTGVFDVEELVEFLREQKAKDIVAIYIPPELKFVEYLVIATIKTKRQGVAITEQLIKVFKRKKDAKDNFIKSEGKGTNWLALDMGNIALHVMNQEIRLEKNLESLWTVGPEFDEQSIEWENPYSVKELLKYHREINENR